MHVLFVRPQLISTRESISFVIITQSNSTINVEVRPEMNRPNMAVKVKRTLDLFMALVPEAKELIRRLALGQFLDRR
jgi:hypothetical protein